MTLYQGCMGHPFFASGRGGAGQKTKISGRGGAGNKILGVGRDNIQTRGIFGAGAGPDMHPCFVLKTS